MKRLVIKVGSAVLRDERDLAVDRLNNLVDFIAQLRQEKQYDIILVSSGAVAAGNLLLNLDQKKVSNRQVLASIGQPLLMKYYKERFELHKLNCAQMLLVSDDFDSRKRSSNAKKVMEIVLKNGVVPILNENDVIANDELLFGDNDQLAAHATHYFDADMLVILTDVDGFYDANPHTSPDARLLKEVDVIDPEQIQLSYNPNSEFATGGITTKLKAADFLLQHNRKLYLSSGFDLSYVKDFLLHNRHSRGTLFKRR